MKEGKEKEIGERGIVIPLFALAILPLFIFAALAVDVANMSRIHTAAQRAADAATLAGQNFRLTKGFCDVNSCPGISNTTNSSELLGHMTQVACQNLQNDGVLDFATCMQNSNNETEAIYSPQGPSGSNGPEIFTMNINIPVDYYFAPAIPGIDLNDSKISVTATASMKPANAILLVDISQSMNNQSKFEPLKNSLISFIGQFNPYRDRVSLITFNTTAQVIYDMRPESSSLLDGNFGDLLGFDQLGMVNYVQGQLFATNNLRGKTNVADALRQAYYDAFFTNNGGWKHDRAGSGSDSYYLDATGNLDLNFVLFTDGAPTAGTFFYQNANNMSCSQESSGGVINGGCLSMSITYPNGRVGMTPIYDYDEFDIATFDPADTSLWATCGGAPCSEIYDPSNPNLQTPELAAFVNTGFPQVSIDDPAVDNAAVSNDGLQEPFNVPDLSFCVPNCDWAPFGKNEQRNYNYSPPLQLFGQTLPTNLPSFANFNFNQLNLHALSYGGSRNLGLKSFYLLALTWADFIRGLSQDIRGSRIYVVAYGNTAVEGWHLPPRSDRRDYPTCGELANLTNVAPLPDGSQPPFTFCQAACGDPASINCDVNDYHFPYQDVFDDTSYKSLFLGRLAGDSYAKTQMLAPESPGGCDSTTTATNECRPSRPQDFPVPLFWNGWGNNFQDNEGNNGRVFPIDCPAICGPGADPGDPTCRIEQQCAQEELNNAYNTIARKIAMSAGNTGALP